MRPFLTLKRVTGSTEFGVFGTLHNSSGIPFAVTLEKPWDDNKVNVSCIPAGDYICKKINSPKFGRVFELQNVPGRSHILIHKGNLVRDTSGCIIVGERFDPLEDKAAVLSSGDAFKELMNYQLLDMLEFWIRVMWTA